MRFLPSKQSLSPWLFHPSCGRERGAEQVFWVEATRRSLPWRASMHSSVDNQGSSAETNHTIDNTDLSSRNIMRTMRNDGVKDWWFTHSKSFRHSIFVLILTHMSAFPFANWPAPSPINARARSHLRWP